MTTRTSENTKGSAPGVGHNRPPEIQTVPIDSLKLHPADARGYTDRDIKRAGRVIDHFGVPLPILTSNEGFIVHGQLLWLAAKAKGISEVSAIRARDMSPLEERMLSAALSRIGDMGKWKIEKQRELFLEVADQMPQLIECMAFDMTEIDIVLDDLEPFNDKAESPIEDGPAVARRGDIFQIGDHRAGCGDATDPEFWTELMAGKVAAAAITDPPYGPKISGFVSTKKRREFVQGSGMSIAELEAFAVRFCAAMATHIRPGGIAYICMDWRGFAALVSAARPVFGELINLAVWKKDRAGLGSFLRSQHELVLIFAKPGGKRRNNVALGANGRHRTNVWEYPCAATLGRTSEEGNMLAIHSTPKPVKLLADALLDSTARADIVVDPFLGSGSSLVAADKVGRVCYGMDLDPLYVDASIRRLQNWTGLKAVHTASGRSFDELEAEAAEQL